MELLDPGTQIDAEGLRVGGTLGGVLTIDQRINDAPHGDVYRARFESQPVLVTFLDPVLAAQADVRSWMLRNIARAATVEHRNLLVQHGTFIHGRRCFVVQGHPDGQTARQLLHERAARGKAMDRDTAQTIVGHVCNALTALHQVTVHGNVTLDTVWISSSGRVMLSDPGIGALLSQTRRFERLRGSGRLPNVAPEQMLAPPPMSPGTDVFGVATLMLELVTGRPLPDAGVPMRALGLYGPDDFVLCLERATAPDAGARPPDVHTFKTELAESLMGDPPLDLRAPDDTASAVPHPSSLADPRLHGGLMPPAAAPQMMPAPQMPAPQMMGQPGLGAPMAGMPQMMVPGIGLPAGAVVPAGFSVVGVPMAGPGGVTTMVPVLISTPTAAPPVAPATASSAARARAIAGQSSDAMRELDRATRRIAASMPKDGLDEMTEDVSQTATRIAADSEGALNLDLHTAEEAADRLETLDAGVPEVVRPDPTPIPSDDAAFFPSFAPAEADGESSTSKVRRGGIALDEDDIEAAPRGYLLPGDPVEHAMPALVMMVRRGKLVASDTIIHPLTQRRLNVLDVPELRVEIATAAIPPPTRPFANATPVAQRPMLVQKNSAFGSTMLWIAIAVLGFAGVGAWMWWRANGG